MAKFKRSIVILLADDDEDDFILVKAALEESELPGELHFVRNGEELLEYLHHSGGYSDHSLAPRPDLILLDLNMPRVDGRKALEEIKSDPNLRSIPVVILTTSSESEDILSSYNRGANSYITKPVTFDALVSIVKMLGIYWFDVVKLPHGHNGPNTESSS